MKYFHFEAMGKKEEDFSVIFPVEMSRNDSGNPGGPRLPPASNFVQGARVPR